MDDSFCHASPIAGNIEVVIYLYVLTFVMNIPKFYCRILHNSQTQLVQHRQFADTTGAKKARTSNSRRCNFCITEEQDSFSGPNGG